eukprot:g1646.t1
MSKEAVVFVGGLPLDVKEWELIETFEKYGEIRNVDLKLPARPPGFAFIQFSDPRDAQAAVDGKDGYDFFGYRIRVELSHGGYRSRTGGYYRNKGSKMFGVSKKTEYRVVVTGLPRSCSWQDLKDHMRKAGDVTYADVINVRDGLIGLVDYATEDDMRYAIRKLDDTEFENPFDRAYVRVKEYTGQSNFADEGRSRYRSRSLSRSRSRSYRSRSRGRGRSSPRRSRSASSRGRRRSISDDRRRRWKDSSGSRPGRSSSLRRSPESRGVSPKRNGGASSRSPSVKEGSFELKKEASKSPAGAAPAV